MFDLRIEFFTQLKNSFNDFNNSNKIDREKKNSYNRYKFHHFDVVEVEKNIDE